MRLLFISNLYPPAYVGGYELNCADIARGLAAKGHQVHILTSTFGADVIARDEAGVDRLLRLRRDWQSATVQPTLRSVGDSVAVQRRNVQVVRGLLDNFQPQVVVIWNGLHLGRGLLTATEERSRTVYYLEDTWLEPFLPRRSPEPSRWHVQRLYHRLLGAVGIPHAQVRGDRLIFCSRALQAEYERRGARGTGQSVIYLGVPSDLFARRPQHILRREPSEPHRILYSGQIAPHKGVGALIAALHRLRMEPCLGRTELTLLGSVRGESYGAQLHAQIAELGLEDAVTFCPARSRDALPPIFAEHDVLVFPSEWVEPFALTPLEAMAIGLPIVSTLRGGSAEVVRDGENALVFRAGDPDDLARKLSWMLRHPEEAAAMGARASVEVHQRFTLDAQVASLEAYLEAVVRT